MSESIVKSIRKKIVELAYSLKARPMFKNNLTPIDKEGHVVAFRYSNGYCNAMSIVDIEDYYTLGSTN